VGMHATMSAAPSALIAFISHSPGLTAQAKILPAPKALGASASLLRCSIGKVTPIPTDTWDKLFYALDPIP
jgi:hypothetical protein